MFYILVYSTHSRLLAITKMKKKYDFVVLIQDYFCSNCSKEVIITSTVSVRAWIFSFDEVTYTLRPLNLMSFSDSWKCWTALQSLTFQEGQDLEESSLGAYSKLFWCWPKIIALVTVITSQFIKRCLGLSSSASQNMQNASSTIPSLWRYPPKGYNASLEFSSAT